MLRSEDARKGWVVIDASNMVLGRLASRIALMLRGKDKVEYTPHVDCGTNVIVINAEKIALTGKKLENDVFYWHTGYPGGIRSATMKERLSGKHPERVLYKAVERMMPKESPLARKQLRCLYIYCGEAHPHAAQNPVNYTELRSINRKNVKES